jgi:OmpA-OmpF porin, OOP family
MKLSRVSFLFGVGLLSLTLGACTSPNAGDEWKMENQDGWKVGSNAQHHPQKGKTNISAIGTQCYFCDGKGMVKDGDNDGVLDDKDSCPTTPAGVVVDSKGCALDSDNDGVPGYRDNCPGTPAGVAVNAMGCAPDSDGDGVADYRDKCPGTMKNVPVNSRGCPLDSDKDGVTDNKDDCPKTPRGASVTTKGCWVLKNLHFDTSKSKIKSSSYRMLDKVANVLKKAQNLQIEIQGHTDSKGSDATNARLSMARAKSVLRYFVGKGVNADRLTAKGFGPSMPVASNATAEGRANNRRVELNPTQR